MSFVKDTMGTLFGGKPKVVNGKNFTPMSEQETNRLQDIEQQLKALYADQSGSNELADMFKQNLKSFMTSDFGPNPTAEQLQQATSFIDDTFTNPAQQQLNQYSQDFQSQAAANAAAMGRNPNLDQSTQASIAAEIAKQGLNLQAERGNRIAQQAQMLNDQGYARGLQNLNTLQQGGGFLSDLANRAFSNRVNLLNARSGIGQFYQNERSQKPLSVEHSAGLLGQVSGGVEQLGNFGGGRAHINEFIGSIMGGGGGAGSGGAASKAGFLSFMSDVNVKQDIAPASDEIWSFLDTLQPYTYTYKNSKHGVGTHLSVMAQDLEKSKFGKMAVEETSEGKRVNYAKLLGVMLAAQVDLHKRLKDAGV